MNDEHEEGGFTTLGEASDEMIHEANENVLDKEDEIGHADVVFADMGLAHGTVVRPVYSGGAWFTYSEVKGVWSELHQSKVRKFIMGLPKLARWRSDRGPRKIALSNARLTSIEKMMEKMVCDDMFFEAAVPAMTFQNVTLRFDEAIGKAVPHSSELRCRSHFEFEFSSKAECPEWLAFLDSVFVDDGDKADKILFLQEFVGAAMRWQSTYFERICLLLGYQGRNGKSIFCDIIGRLFKDSICSVPPQELSNREARVSLDGAQLNMVTDIPVTPMKDTGGLKQVTSGDKVAARRLHRQEFLFTPKSGHLYSANLLPRSPDTSEGFYRRWIIIMFNRSFTGSEARGREELLDSLGAELPGIALWALKGSRSVAERGRYVIPPSSEERVREWERENNIIQQFIEDACIVGFGECMARPLYDSFKNWAEYNGYMKFGASGFYARIEKIDGVRKKVDGAIAQYNIDVLSRDKWASNAEKMPTYEDSRQQTVQCDEDGNELPKQGGLF